MDAAGARIGMRQSHAGGADNFVSDFPLTGAPSLNAAFLGARAVFNLCGDFYAEPMMGINAEFSWNAHAPGFRDHLNHDEARVLVHSYIYDQDQPEAVFGKGGLYHRVCELLYGPNAGPIMAEYYRESAWIPDVELSVPASSRGHYHNSYLPITWNRAYVIPTHWRHLAVDSKTWHAEITNWRFLKEFRPLNIDRQELHRRLARRWSVVAELNKKGANYIKQALAAKPLAGAREDLEYLQELFRVYQPFCEALVDFHQAFHRHLVQPKERSVIVMLLRSAASKAKQARELARHAFPHPIDPSGGELGALRRKLDEFIEAAAAMENRAQQGGSR